MGLTLGLTCMPIDTRSLRRSEPRRVARNSLFVRGKSDCTAFSASNAYPGYTVPLGGLLISPKCEEPKWENVDTFADARTPTKPTTTTTTGVTTSTSGKDKSDPPQHYQTASDAPSAQGICRSRTP